MKSQMSFVCTVIAVFALLCIGSPAWADNIALCPNTAGVDGYGGETFTNVAGAPAPCGANGAVQMYVPNETTGYARLAWSLNGVSLGTLAGATANVGFVGVDQPFYMLGFYDATDGLGQGAATDQILMIEFQSSSLNGNTLALDPNATLFNLYDNTTGKYLNLGAGGQHDVNTLAGWLSADPFLKGEALGQIRIGIGMAGGGTDPITATVYSLDLSTVPEPTSVTLLLTLLGTAGLGVRLKQRRSRRG